MSQNEWIERFTKEGWLWLHDGNPKRPHALLVSENHSNGYFNATGLTQNPNHLHQACDTLEKQCRQYLSTNRSSDVLYPDWVFGSAYGAMFIAYEVAKRCDCKAGYTLPYSNTRSFQRKMFVPSRFDIQKGQKVMLVEDVLTTGETTMLSAQDLEHLGAEILPVILVIVNRSGKKELEGRKIVSLIDAQMPVWQPDECPLCKEGSEAIRPKGNWDKLTGDYQ